MLVDLAGREQERLSMCRTERFKDKGVERESKGWFEAAWFFKRVATLNCAGGKIVNLHARTVCIVSLDTYCYLLVLSIFMHLLFVSHKLCSDLFTSLFIGIYWILLVYLFQCLSTGKLCIGEASDKVVARSWPWSIDPFSIWPGGREAICGLRVMFVCKMYSDVTI